MVRKGRREPVLLSRYATELCVRGQFDEALKLLDPVHPSDSYTDTIRALAILATPTRRGEIDRCIEDYFRRYDGPGDQVFGIWLPWFAGKLQLASSMGMSFNRKPPVGFELRRAEYHRASKYLADLLTHDEYLAASRGTIGEFWDAHFLVGVRKLSAGKRTEGLEHLRLVTRIRTPISYTYEFARVIPAVLEREPVWPPAH